MARILKRALPLRISADMDRRLAVLGEIEKTGRSALVRSLIDQASYQRLSAHAGDEADALELAQRPYRVKGRTPKVTEPEPDAGAAPAV